MERAQEVILNLASLARVPQILTAYSLSDMDNCLQSHSERVSNLLTDCCLNDSKLTHSFLIQLETDLKEFKDGYERLRARLYTKCTEAQALFLPLESDTINDTVAWANSCGFHASITHELATQVWKLWIQSQVQRRLQQCKQVTSAQRMSGAQEHATAVDLATDWKGMPTQLAATHLVDMALGFR